MQKHAMHKLMPIERKQSLREGKRDEKGADEMEINVWTNRINHFAVEKFISLSL